MALLLVLGSFLLPENRDPNAGRLDLFSVGLSLVAMLSIVYAIKRVAQDGLDVIAAIAAVIGVSLAVVFVRRQSRLSDPLIDLRLFEVPAFTASICTQLLALTAIAGIYLFTAQYMQLVLGMSPLRAGLWMLPWTVAGMVASMFTPAIARRIKPAYVMGAGLVLAAVGMVVLTRISEGPGLTLMLLSFVITPAGINPTMTLTTDMIMTVAPPDRAGAASAISETSCELGLSLGMAILGSIGTASYRRIMAENVRGVSTEVAESARSTLGAAIAAADGLGGQLGADLTATARNAFAQSLEVVAAIAAVMVLIMGIAVVVLLRGVTPSRSAEESASSSAASATATAGGAATA